MTNRSAYVIKRCTANYQISPPGVKRKGNYDMDIETKETTTNTEQNELGASEETKKPDNLEEQKIPYDRFKAKVDEVNEMRARLDAIEAEKAEARRKELVEQNKFEEIAKDLEAQLQTHKEDALVAKKHAMLAKAGYSEEQIERYAKFVVGDNDDELKKSLDELKADVSPKKGYVDPSAGNGAHQLPAKKNPEELGKTAYQRLKGLGRIR